MAIEPINASFFKEEEDYLYKRGAQKAVEKKNRLFIGNLITKFDLTDEQIAHIIEESVELVSKIRAELQNK